MFPRYEPAIAGKNSTHNNGMWSNNSILETIEANINRVKSTKVETTAAVPIKACFERPALMRKALLNAP